MHSEYLRRLYLGNDLAEGRYKVDGRPVALTDIRVPVFAVATQRDHVSPWRSVYKTHLLTDTELTFLLASGGHNVGIVSAPGHDVHVHRNYQMATRKSNEHYLDPEAWVAATPLHEGSWWPAWQRWLVAHSGKRAVPPAMGAPARGYVPLADAPGEYVLAA